MLKVLRQYLDPVRPRPLDLRFVYCVRLVTVYLPSPPPPPRVFCRPSCLPVLSLWRHASLRPLFYALRFCVPRRRRASSSTQVGFCTFNSSVHYYNLKSDLSQPQMLVVPDLADPFLPVPDDLLVNLSESRSVVDTLLDNLAQASAVCVCCVVLCSVLSCPVLTWFVAWHRTLLL